MWATGHRQSQSHQPALARARHGTRGTGLGCRGVGLTAILRGDPADPHLAWIEQFPDGGGRREVVWPSGFTARFDPQLEIIRRDRAIGARNLRAGIVRLTELGRSLEALLSARRRDSAAAPLSLANANGWPGHPIAELDCRRGRPGRSLSPIRGRLNAEVARTAMVPRGSAIHDIGTPRGIVRRERSRSAVDLGRSARKRAFSRTSRASRRSWSITAAPAMGRTVSGSTCRMGPPRDGARSPRTSCGYSLVGVVSAGTGAIAGTWASDGRRARNSIRAARSSSALSRVQLASAAELWVLSAAHARHRA